MDDIGPLIQYIIPFIIAFIGGAGLTGIVVAIYEARVRRMEKAVDRFSELVLTPVLFRFLSVSWDIITLLEAYDRIRKKESLTIYIDGVLAKVRNLQDWHRQMEVLRKEHGVLSHKISDTGISALAPEKIERELKEIGPTLNEIKRKIGAEEDFSTIMKAGRDQLLQISVDIRKIVGTYGLGEE